MTTKVTKESLAEKITDLEGYKQKDGFLSLKEEYQLEAFKTLFDYLDSEPDEWSENFKWDSSK